MMPFYIFLALFLLIFQSIAAAEQHPNIIIIYLDDVGYGDLQSYGHPTQEKGAIDVLAEEGMRFTQWYSTSSVCTPSRAALLTGMRLNIMN